MFFRFSNIKQNRKKEIENYVRSGHFAGFFVVSDEIEINARMANKHAMK
jgi:hypothetical protein